MKKNSKRLTVDDASGPDQQFGAMITGGASDWQIFQQDEQGQASISLSGRWRTPDGNAAIKPQVQVRAVDEASGMAIDSSLDWQNARTAGDSTWKMTLKGVPAGGLYRLETRLVMPGQIPTAWAVRGDMRHFVGVGDLWVIAGQSNSAGYGRGPVHDAPQLGVHLFRNSLQWALASHPLNESTDTAHTVNREFANPGHAPWLHWSKLMRSELGYPIGLVQTSLGGSGLVSWNPTERGDHGLWENMRHCVASVGGRVKGVLWYQGESDTGPDLAGTYGERFSRTVTAWRKMLKNPELAVVTVQLNRVYGVVNDDSVDRKWSQVREAQRQAARVLDNVVVVPTLDLPLSDGIHLSPDGNMLLAERSARAALGAFHEFSGGWQAPDAQSARRTGPRAMELLFAHVSTFLTTINVTAKPFRVEDESGLVQVESWVSTGPVVQLKLARDLRGRAVVHGGYGASPDTVPYDEPRVMPILAFYGIPVD